MFLPLLRSTEQQLSAAMENYAIPSTTVALVRMPIYTLTSSQSTYHNPTIYHHLDIDRVGTQSPSARCSMLMRPNKAETAVHGCWLLSSIFIFLWYQQRFIPSTTVALVRMPVALTYTIYTLTPTLPFSITI